MGRVVSLNGELVDPSRARISVYDHGFLFGDSVYETLRTAGGAPYDPQPHLARLRRSARSLRLPVPWSDAELLAEIAAALEAAGNAESYIRLVVTRGVGEIALLPDTCAHPQRIVIVHPLAEVPAEKRRSGIHVVVAHLQRNPARATDPAIKSGNYLNSVLAMMEARDRGADDGIMCNTEGHLAEGTTCNVFFVSGERLRTPALECGILPGVTRDAILTRFAPEAGIPAEEGHYEPAALRGADEAFITSTLRGILPISRVDGSPLRAPVPGPLTGRLAAAYAADLESWAARARPPAAPGI